LSIPAKDEFILDIALNMNEGKETVSSFLSTLPVSELCSSPKRLIVPITANEELVMKRVSKIRRESKTGMIIAFPVNRKKSDWKSGEELHDLEKLCSYFVVSFVTIDPPMEWVEEVRKLVNDERKLLGFDDCIYIFKGKPKNFEKVALLPYVVEVQKNHYRYNEDWFGDFTV